MQAYIAVFRDLDKIMQTSMTHTLVLTCEQFDETTKCPHLFWGSVRLRVCQRSVGYTISSTLAIATGGRIVHNNYASIYRHLKRNACAQLRIIGAR